MDYSKGQIIGALDKLISGEANGVTQIKHMTKDGTREEYAVIFFEDGRIKNIEVANISNLALMLEIVLKCV